MSTGTQDRASPCGLQSWAKQDLEKARMGFHRKDLKQVSLGDSKRQQQWAPGQNRRVPPTPRSNRAPTKEFWEATGKAHPTGRT